MSDLKKDPYLSELDAMDNLEPPPADLIAEGEETVHEPGETDEVTRVDMKAPPLKATEPVSFDMDVPPTGVPDMESEAAEPIEPEGPPPVKELLDLSPDLTVPLVVVMGRKSFTVRDLLALRIGQVMDLERAPLEPVELVAAGKVVGKGELVEVDGKLGIRILKLLK